MWRMKKNMTECARSAVMLDGEISQYVDIFFKELHRDVRYDVNLWKVNINDLTEAVEAAKQGVTAGKYTVSGLMFADDLVGISEAPE